MDRATSYSNKTAKSVVWATVLRGRNARFLLGRPICTRLVLFGVQRYCDTEGGIRGVGGTLFFAPAVYLKSFTMRNDRRRLTIGLLVAYLK